MLYSLKGVSNVDYRARKNAQVRVIKDDGDSASCGNACKRKRRTLQPPLRTARRPPWRACSHPTRAPRRWAAPRWATRSASSSTTPWACRAWRRWGGWAACWPACPTRRPRVRTSPRRARRAPWAGTSRRRRRTKTPPWRRTRPRPARRPQRPLRWRRPRPRRCPTRPRHPNRMS